MNRFIVFSMLYIISTTIDYTHQLCFLYMLSYPVIYSLSERERVEVNMQGTVFTLSKIENRSSYHQELLSSILKH